MKFCNYTCIATDFNKELGSDYARVDRKQLKDLSEMVLDGLIEQVEKRHVSISHTISNSIAIEDLWADAGRPYYDVYPSVSKFIDKLKLNFEASQLSMPQGLKALLLKFPEGGELKYILFTIHRVKETTIISYVVNKGYGDASLAMMQLSLGINDGDTLESSLTKTFNDIVSNKDATEASKAIAKIRWDAIVHIYKVISSVCLIGNDPDFVDPQVLSSDANKVTKDNIDKLLDRAKRRGKFGFSFGESLQNLQNCPHIRAPHWYWQAYGPNWTLVRYRKRKGSVVHRDKIVNVPTGFDENESVHT